MPSCSRRPAVPSLTRQAFLVFDNLTGDPSFDWLSQAAPRILEHDFTGIPKTIPFVAANLREAYLGNAARLIQGYYEVRAGKLHFEIDLEDAGSHRMIQTAAEDGDAAAALNRAAKQLASEAHEFPAAGPAVEAWGYGDFEHAVSLDPGFALAWLSWVQKLAGSGDAVQAREVAGRALMQPKLDSAVDQARLELAEATLRQDDGARIAASRKLAGLIPDDSTLLASVAQEEMRARRFSDAAKDLQALAKANPSDLSILNQLGYAQALSGDIDGARQSLQAYGRGPGPDAVNALDSLGEAYFLNGKFQEAERDFMEAHAKDPAFLQGAELWKAAHAHWLGGDLPGAEAIADRYFEDRAKARDPLVVWRRAVWLYETGRHQEAQALLMNPPPEAAQVARQQLQVWNNLQAIPLDPDQLQQGYRQADPTNDGLVRTLYAEALLREGKKAEAKELLRLWPLPATNDSPLQSLVYPKFLELRKAIG